MKLTQLMLTLAILLAAVIAAGPTLTGLANALVPLVLVVGVIVAVLRIVWAATRRW